MTQSLNQRTLKAPVSCAGVGLHTGAPVTLRLMPARPDTGVVLVRTDPPRKPELQALARHVSATELATTLGQGEAKIHTVEHVLAALAGLGIDNARVELDGPEVPIMDGSAAPFIALIREAGVREQDVPKSFMVIKKAVTVSDGDKRATLGPGRGFRVDCTIDFKHPLISDQTLSLSFCDSTFVREVSSARTFGFLRDVEKLKELGLARGGSLQNAIVVDDFSILNPEGLRFPDEFVRHKMLDALGDLSLLGRPVIGHLTAFKSGHKLNHRLVTQVLSDESNYAVVRARARDVAHYDLRLDELEDALTPSAA
ncbi:MAG: UDP-3-O-acyl-N-acetylglucosamine deacetylase [Archangiaceae bacterium]|nr:UDP-3-O-acyl-N-acetylglucosamine deacetylase [Archangiaceae bacterium]